MERDSEFVGEICKNEIDIANSLGGIVGNNAYLVALIVAETEGVVSGVENKEIVAVLQKIKDRI